MTRVDDSEPVSSSSGHGTQTKRGWQIKIQGKAGIIAGGLVALSLAALYLYRRWTRASKDFETYVEDENALANPIPEQAQCDIASVPQTRPTTASHVTGPKEFRDHLVLHQGEARTAAAIAAGAPAAYFPMPGQYTLEKARHFEERVVREASIALPQQSAEVPSQAALLEFFDHTAHSSPSSLDMGIPITKLVESISTHAEFVALLQSNETPRGLILRLILSLERASLETNTTMMSRDRFASIISQCIDHVETERDTCKRVLRILLKRWPAQVQTMPDESAVPQQLVPPSEHIRQECLTALLGDRTLGPLLAQVADIIDQRSTTQQLTLVCENDRSRSGKDSRQASRNDEHRGYYINESSPYMTARRSASRESSDASIPEPSLLLSASESEDSKSDVELSRTKFPNQPKLSKPLVLRLALLLAMASDRGNSERTSSDDESRQPSPASAWVAAALNLLTQSELAQLELAKLIEASKIQFPGEDDLRTSTNSVAPRDSISLAKSVDSEDRDDDWLHVTAAHVMGTNLPNGGQPTSHGLVQRESPTEAELASSSASSFVRVDYISDDEDVETRVERKELDTGVTTTSHVVGYNAIHLQSSTLADRVNFLLESVTAETESADLPLSLSIGSADASFESSDVVATASAAIAGGWSAQLAGLAQPLRNYIDTTDLSLSADLVLDVERLSDLQETLFEKAVAARLLVLWQRTKPKP